jgi:hypothetical protein
VDPIDGGLHALTKNFRDGLVRRQHAFLDELVALGVDDGLGDGGATLVIESDLDFRHFEIEGAVFKPAAAPPLKRSPIYLVALSFVNPNSQVHHSVKSVYLKCARYLKNAYKIVTPKKYFWRVQQNDS